MPLLKSHIVATFGEFGDFDSYSGGGIERALTPYTAAGQQAAEQLEGTHSVTDVTLMRAYDPKRDDKLKDYANKAIRGKETPRAVTIKKFNAQGIVIAIDSHPRCKVKSLTMPDGKAGDNSVAEVTMVLAVEALV